MLGVVLSVILAWRVPHLFHDMPAAFYHDARVSLILLGVSLSFGLVCSVTSAIFLGLQRYGVPTLLTLANRMLFTAAVLLAVRLHSSLAVMGAAVAVVNVLTGVAQVAAWRRFALHIRLSLRKLDFAVVRQMLVYCSVIGIWLLGMLCVSGLDLTIVGRYDFAHTAFYSIALLPNNFLIAILGAALGPLLPEASARNAASNPRAMGEMLARTTRYSVLLLVLTGMPLLLGGFYALRVWVGLNYALHAIGYLRWLVLGQHDPHAGAALCNDAGRDRAPAHRDRRGRGRGGREPGRERLPGPQDGGRGCRHWDGHWIGGQRADARDREHALHPQHVRHLAHAAAADVGAAACTGVDSGAAVACTCGGGRARRPWVPRCGSARSLQRCCWCGSQGWRRRNACGC